MAWLSANTGLISAILGFLSALTLGYPAWREIRDRRQWDTLQKTVHEQTDRLRSSGTPTSTLAQLDEVQWAFVKQRMGSYLSHRRTIVVGIALLGASFAFDIWDNVQEQNAASQAQAAAVAGTALPRRAD